jgi:hypothetical protein
MEMTTRRKDGVVGRDPLSLHGRDSHPPTNPLVRVAKSDGEPS